MSASKALQKVFYGSSLYLKRHSSTILTCVGAVGVIATSVIAVKATPKAIKLLERAEEEKGEELTKTEVILTAAPAYIPATVVGASTIACIFGANVLNKRQQAAITSAYALVNSTYKDYRNKLKELYGEEADTKIQEAIMKDKRDEEVSAFAPGINSLPQSGEEKHLFYEEHRGKFFEATMGEVLNAEYHINRNLALRGWTNLNEFYSFLGLEKEEFGSVLGWSCWNLLEETESCWLDFDHRLMTVSDDGLQAYKIVPMFEPTAGYDE